MSAIEILLVFRYHYFVNAIQSDKKKYKSEVSFYSLYFNGNLYKIRILFDIYFKHFLSTDNACNGRLRPVGQSCRRSVDQSNFLDDYLEL